MGVGNVDGPMWCNASAHIRGRGSDTRCDVNDAIWVESSQGNESSHSKWQKSATQTYTAL